MVGSHFTREVLVKLQKGLKFIFLESHNLDIFMYSIHMSILIT